MCVLCVCVGGGGGRGGGGNLNPSAICFDFFYASHLPGDSYEMPSLIFS